MRKNEYQLIIEQLTTLTNVVGKLADQVGANSQRLSAMESGQTSKKSAPKTKTKTSKKSNGGKVYSENRLKVYEAMGVRLTKDGKPYKGDFDKKGGYEVYKAKAIELGLWVEKA